MVAKRLPKRSRECPGTIMASICAFLLADIARILAWPATTHNDLVAELFACAICDLP